MKRCSESFTVWRNGAPVAFVAGQLIDDKHPILKTHGHLFAEPTASVPGGSTALHALPAEQATNEPGEQRTLTPPTQTAARVGGDGEPFDPGKHNADEVLEYLKGADEEERARVLAAEAEGRKRKGILGDAAKE